MSIFRSKDQRGSFYKASKDSPTKYYYTTQNRASRLKAMNSAKRESMRNSVSKRNK